MMMLKILTFKMLRNMIFEKQFAILEIKNDKKNYSAKAHFFITTSSQASDFGNVS